MVNPTLISENLQYHLDRGMSVAESIFRPGSMAHIQLLVEARSRFDAGEMNFTGVDKILFIETDLGKTDVFEGRIVPLDFPIEEIDLNEAKYQGKEVRLGYPQRGGAKKYHVYVKNPKTGNIKKISFGDVHGGLTAKVSNPKARASFAARHQCHLKKDKTKAGYWACRINRYAHLWGGKTYPGFW
jgi:hypothetical protein